MNISIAAHNLNTSIACAIKALLEKSFTVSLFTNNSSTKSSYDHQLSISILKTANEDKLAIHPFFEARRTQPNSTVFTTWSHCYPATKDEWAIYTELSKDSHFIIYDGNFGKIHQKIKAQLIDISKYPKFFHKAKGVIQTVCPNRFDALLFKRKTTLPVTPSTDFTWRTKSSITDLISKTKTESRRNRILFFCGASTPTRDRLAQKILDHTKELYPNISPKGDVMASPCTTIFTDLRINNREYLNTLDSSSFALCLPGALPWSHRTIESCYRLAIPITARSESQFLDNQLTHMHNSILVDNSESPQAWIEAVETVRSLSRQQIDSMRSNLQQTVKTTLSWTSLKDKIARALFLR